MKREIVSLSYLVKDYDEAIEYFTRKLNFELIEDSDLGNDKRWVLVRPKNALGVSLLLAKGKGETQSKAIGQQSGGRVFLILQTEDFDSDYELMKSNGVTFSEEPRVEPYGKVVVFTDLYGNKWDLLERY